MNASALSFAAVENASSSAAKYLLHSVQDLYAALPVATQVAAFASVISQNTCPVAVITSVFLESSSLHTEQYTTDS